MICTTLLLVKLFNLPLLALAIFRQIYIVIYTFLRQYNLEILKSILVIAGFYPNLI